MPRSRTITIQSLIAGRYNARFADTEHDIDRALDLRALAFRDAAGQGEMASSDRDRFDACCQHLLVEETATGNLVAALRLMPLTSGAEIPQSYAARFYDLAGLGTFAGPMAELGRFCLHPARHDPDILRLVWAALARHVDARGIEMLFGCTSFAGTDPAPYRDAFAMLAASHTAPAQWQPQTRAAEVVAFAPLLTGVVPDRKRAMQTMPPLLRTYIAMGGWVSDHAVIDRDLGTLHVFTALKIADIPAARICALRKLAG